MRGVESDTGGAFNIKLIFLPYLDLIYLHGSSSSASQMSVLESVCFEPFIDYLYSLNTVINVCMCVGEQGLVH